MNRTRSVLRLGGSTALLWLPFFAACQASEPQESTPQALRIKLNPDQYRAAVATWSDAAIRIDRELIQADASQDPKAIRMVRYRRAFAAVVLERIRSGQYQIVIIDPDNSPAPTNDLLSTYAHVFRDETGSFGALIQVRRVDNPELFELFEATKHDFVPEPSKTETSRNP
jgi:hypothetical protein